MPFATKTKGNFTVTAHGGDAKTLLAFNLPKSAAKNLAGFTIQAAPDGQTPYFIFNNLQYANPAKHAQVAEEPANATINAPIHKFLWLHVPGSVHQGTDPFFGKYTYTVTPRYFNGKGSMLPIDATLSVSVTIDVVPFDKGNIVSSERFNGSSRTRSPRRFSLANSRRATRSKSTWRRTSQSSSSGFLRAPRRHRRQAAQH